MFVREVSGAWNDPEAPVWMSGSEFIKKCGFSLLVVIWPTLYWDSWYDLTSCSLKTHVGPFSIENRLLPNDLGLIVHCRHKGIDFLKFSILCQYTFFFATNSII